MTMKYDKKPCIQGMYAGLLRMCLAFAFAAAAATMAYAADWYVDANNGNDDWDGTTATIPTQATIEAGGTIAGPRKTLHAMMSDERVVAGDTVWAAEGDYKEGGEVNGEGTTINRVQVKGGVTLRASGSRDNTFISGAKGVEGKYTAGATRCVFFLPPVNEADGYGIVKGFTIRKGRTAPGRMVLNEKNEEEEVKEYGGGTTGAGLVSECDFDANGDKPGRGGSMYKGYAIRCSFNTIDNGFHAYSGTWIISSLFLDGKPYDGCKVVNCTFLGDSNTRDCDTYNCLFIGTGASDSSQSIKQSDGTYSSKTIHSYVFSRSEFHSDACTVDDKCRVVTESQTPYDEMTFRPLAGSVVIDAGKTSYYENTTNRAAWRRGAWLAEAAKDYYGNDRVVNGKIDVGCGERQSGSSLMIADESDGLVVEGAAKGLSQISDSAEIAFSRTFTSDKLCLGVMVNGDFHSFGGTTSDVPHIVTHPGGGNCDYNITAVYETDQKDWYVSPDGDNANKGYHRNCPRKTLDKAMELATENAGHVVHAAAGTYDSFAEGDEYASARSRVTVKEGVGLVADDWPLKDTVIKGASNTDATSEYRDKYGNGPNAVRCVWVNKNGYVRGFKLTDGRTSLTNGVGTGASSGSCGGGAVLISPAALIDCEITGNGTGYRGSAVAGTEGESGTRNWLIRCYVHDNDANGGNYQIFDRTSIADSYVDGGNDTPYYCRGSSIILNSTIAKGTARAWNNLYAYNSYFYNVSRGGGTFSLFNCAFMGENKYDGTTIIPDESSIFNVAMEDNLGENRRPKATSVLVDAGVNSYYEDNFPAQFAQFKNGRDSANGQRIYNCRIDIGGGEYDFRGDFAKMLGARGTIEEMGPNVTTNALRNVVVPEGESIAVSVAPVSADRNTRYELVYTPDGDSPVRISESSKESFSRTLDGPCTVQTLNGYLGFVFQVR